MTLKAHAAGATGGVGFLYGSCISGRTFLTGTDTLQLLLETVLAEKSFHSPQPYAIHHPVFDKQGTTNINQKALYSIKSIQFWIN